MLCAPLLNTINRFVRNVQKNGETAKFRAQLQVLPIFVQQQRLLDVYKRQALDDLLAGSTDFTPLNFAE